MTTMNLLNPDLAARLRRRHVDVQIQDDDTILLRNVPADRRRFNKPATNLLLARPQVGMPFLVCVDEDLEYTGGDRFLLRAFAGAHLKQGWRVLNLCHEDCRDPHRALQLALGALGFDLRGAESGRLASRIPLEEPTGLLARFGTDLSRNAQDPDVEPTVGRRQELERVVASASGWQARLPLIAGESGIGKTNLLHAVTRKLAERRPGSSVISVNLAVLLAGTLCESERENILSALFHEAARNFDSLILAMEHMEMAFLGNPCGALLVEQALDDGLRLVGTVLPQSMPRAAAGVLSRRLDLVRLEELDAAETIEVLGHLRERLVWHHRVQIDASILGPTVERAASLAGWSPSKAISLLDSAAARAAFQGAEAVEILHVYAAGNDFPAADPET